MKHLFVMLLFFNINTAFAADRNFNAELSSAACQEGLKCEVVSFICEEGADCYYSYLAAQRACRERGGRLPYLKELAFAVASRADARGLAPASSVPPVYTPTHSDDRHIKSQDAYRLIQYKTSTGQSDRFYFSIDGFHGDGFGQPFWADAISDEDCMNAVGPIKGCAVQVDFMGAYPSYYYKNGWARLACVIPKRSH